MSENFKKTVEDFDCVKCGFYVKGDGYTNHCPQCFTSLHVDNAPGDRGSECLGQMKVVKVEVEGQLPKLYFECQRCGVMKNCRADEDDDFTVLAKIVENLNQKEIFG